MKNVSILTTSFAVEDNASLQNLRNNGYDVILNPYGRKVSEDEIIKLAQNSVGIIAGLENYSLKVLKELPTLRVISRVGIGLDNIDLITASQRNVTVCNTPDSVTLAVAELTVALILNLFRNISLSDRKLRKSVWKKEMGSLLTNKKIGIIGLGRIGSKVADLLKPFNLTLVYCDIKPCSDQYTFESLETLLSSCDIVSLHCPWQSEKGYLLNRKKISLMKRGAYLINTSRGGAVDEDALYEALKKHYLAGAALDVYEKEPYEGKLLELDNVVLTAHIGSYARESRIMMEREATENLIKALQNKFMGN